MSKYGHSVLNIRRVYSTEILRYTYFCVAEKNGSLSSFFSNKRRKLCFVINVLNNKTIILLNLGACRLILANLANGLVG